MVALATWGECSGFQDLESHPIHKILQNMMFQKPRPHSHLLSKVFPLSLYNQGTVLEDSSALVLGRLQLTQEDCKIIASE